MDDLRATIEGAFNAAESTQGSEAPSGHESSGPGEVASTDAPGQSADGVDGRPEPVVARDSGPVRARDEKGKFAPKDKAAQVTQAQGEAVAPASVSSSPPQADAASVPPPAEVIKAPQSWTPAEREAFAKAPPDVQRAIARREYQTQREFEANAPAKRFEAEFKQATAPFEGMFQRAGLNPIQAAQSAFNTIHQLQNGNDHTKAQILAGLIKSYGVNIEALAGAIDGAPQQQQQAHIDPDVIAQRAEERVFQRMAQQRQQANQARLAQELDAFAADPANEFLNDVAPVMTALIHATPQGQEADLKAAYERAIWSDPSLRAILQQREQAKSVANAQASTQRASAAGSSIRNQPASPVNGAKPGDLRSDIMAAMAKVSGR